MKKITYLLLFTISLFVFNSCSEKVDGTEDINYVSFQSTSLNFGVDLDGTNERDIKIYTTQVTGSDRTFTVEVDTDASTADPVSYVVPTTITVLKNVNVGILPVSISDINIGEEGKTLVLKLGAKEGLFTGDDITLNISQVCPVNEVIFSIAFDGWPSETYWELVDADDNIIASGGPYSQDVKDTSFSKAFCLEDGTYTFTIYDAYGDGSGPYSLNYNGTSLISSDGGFGDSESTTFTVSM